VGVEDLRRRVPIQGIESILEVIEEVSPSP